MEPSKKPCHSDLGELIDLPPLPCLEETVAYNNLEDELWFATLHITPEQSILMRIFEAESHATMRIANKDDIREQMRRVSIKQAEEKLPTLPVLYDIYTEISAGGTQSFYAVPKLKAQPEFPCDTRPTACAECAENWNPELPGSLEYLFDEIVLFNHGLSNPMTDCLEAIVEDL
ncbi:uncharacterized protein LOC118504964 isoform X2 [Anopheles stephensi]|uniref:uncharacterized protein LOC118504964 isoform X2 n=1 Tax=Anopheles stephensi TaxID=30069 RepID=UPI0016589BE0|nr:uncharacterized protein LOC118504964 isoform X2 [Anopheles stephensi]